MDERKRKKGRPKMKTPGRVRKVDLRFTQDEYTLLMDMANKSVLSRSELCRNRILQNGNAALINLIDMTRNLDLLGLELSRAGNNINQLARYSNILIKNAMLCPVVSQRFSLELLKYQSLQKKIESLLRKLIYQSSA